jgi:hypothetical protein
MHLQEGTSHSFNVLHRMASDNLNHKNMNSAWQTCICRCDWTLSSDNRMAGQGRRYALLQSPSDESHEAPHNYSTHAAWIRSNFPHLIYRLEREPQLGIVNGVVFCRVVDVWDLGDIKLLALLLVEGLEQLVPAVKHEQQALAATWLPWLHTQPGTQTLE